MATTQPTHYSELPDFIKKAIDREIKLATEEELENAKKRIDERKSQIIAGVLLYVQKQIEFTTLDQKLIIHVKTN